MGGAVRHSTERMLAYHSGALSGPVAYGRDLGHRSFDHDLGRDIDRAHQGPTSRASYLRIFEAPLGSRIEVHQLADDPGQAEFLDAAWSMVLGRFREAYADGALAPVPARTRRAKRRRS